MLFKEQGLEFFAIAAGKSAINNCSCEAAKKVLQRETKFLNDQRSDRKKAVIANGKTTKKLTKTLQRKEKQSAQSRTISL